MLVAALLANTLGLALGADPTPKPETRPPPRASISVKVVDESGNPVEGAVITPYVLRYEQALCFWGDQAYGPWPMVKTDAAGEVQVPYPVETAGGHKTERIGFTVDHPRFCRLNAGCVVRSSRAITRRPQPSDPPPPVPGLEPILGYETKIETRAAEPIILKRGTQLEISAYLDGSGDPASGVLAQSPSIDSDCWKEVRPGVLQTDRLPAGVLWFRLAFLPANSPAFFSDSVKLDVKLGESRQIKLPLKQGVRLEGQLAPAVHRPVHNGWVSIVMMAKSTYAERERARLEPPITAERLRDLDPLTWSASARVGEDGSFVFPALPPGEAGLVAGCDGFLSTDPAMIGRSLPIDQETDVQRNAHSIALEGSLVKFTIPMEKTGTAEFTILDPAGHPISGATLHFLCNWNWQDTYNWLGWEEYGGAERLRDPSWHRKTSDVFPRYAATSDAIGIARVPNLPGGRLLYHPITHPNFSPPDEVDPPSYNDGVPGSTIVIVTGEISKRTAQLRPK